MIQFVGTTLLGTFPTMTYRHFLKSLFEAGYTVVSFPFRFTLDHWSVALDLLEEHYAVRGAMIEAAVAKGYDPGVYLDVTNYTWIGHGLGCKYVTLLEVLSSPMEVLEKHFQILGQDLATQNRQIRQLQTGLAALQNNLRSLEQRILQLTGQTVDYGQPSIMDEASLLLAPVVTDLNGAIPVKFLERFFGRRITIYPTVEQTHQLIEHSQLFHLTGLLQFARDRIAADTCQQLMQEQPHIRRRLLKGNHSEVVGLQLGQCVVDMNPLDKFIQPLTHRDLESKSLTFLQRLRHQPASVSRQSNCRASDRRSIAA
ncbi:DUF1350 family protein [Leptothoe spongobia TAU-MAC 1115]|uniref:DUF1350 family protein n=1 Tax=Leptothoe spongobia TAU-MAC 1115 TaxID=1967444 RepID=A0A947DGB2_9CYAN|nr:DUF1350 family protein [Leptothoe spongobia TAU-MAC 1115]